MGRKPKVRASYQHDAGYLIRLADAVDRDPTKEREWKAEVRSKLHSVASMFLTDVSRKIAS